MKKISRRAFLQASAAGLVASAVTQTSARATSVEANGQFAGKTVLVTGGTSGLGKQFVFDFAKAGALVFFCGRNQARGKSIEETISKRGQRALFFQADIGQEASVRELFKNIQTQSKNLDIAINNAGVMETKVDFLDSPLERFTEVIQINLMGSLYCLREEIALMKKQRGGSIVNMLSLTAVRPAPDAPAYCASKMGLLGLTTSLAKKYAPDGIRINGVTPSYVDHDIGSTEDRIAKGSNKEAKLQQRMASGRLITVEEVAKTVLWLSSNDASAISGENLMVTGGGYN